MSYWVNCCKCNGEIQYTDYRFILPDDDRTLCYDCTEKLKEVIDKWLEKKEN